MIKKTLSVFIAMIMFLSAAYVPVYGITYSQSQKTKEYTEKYDNMLKNATIVNEDNYLDVFQQYADDDETELYKDCTVNFYTLLLNNLVISSMWRKQSVFGWFNFYYAVRNYGVWDYKRDNRQPSWTAAGGYFSAYFVNMDCEILGNLNFGFTGAATGFSPKTLFNGGGIVAVKGRTATWEDWCYYFDSKEDHKWIAFGILLYSLINKSYTKDMQAIDLALTVLDPRLVSVAYKLYVDLK